MGDNVYIILELVTILLFWPNLPCIKIMKYLGRECTKLSTPAEKLKEVPYCLQIRHLKTN